jgi:hypothetical protein
MEIVELIAEGEGRRPVHLLGHPPGAVARAGPNRTPLRAGRRSRYLPSARWQDRRRLVAGGHPGAAAPARPHCRARVAGRHATNPPGAAGNTYLARCPSGQGRLRLAVACLRADTAP